ncbi:MAG: MAPEG family protein [Hyphomicrobiales bacterium]|nr:MAPEG family protein [Hyphomicrobiales bacterium]
MTLTQHLLLPAFVQFALTVYVLVRMGQGRVRAVRSGQVKRTEIDTRSAYSETVQKFANNYVSQFELPVLFYVVLAFALATGLVDFILIGLAWAFVGARLVHSFEHTGRNRIATRFKVFVAGLVFLVGMWAWFGLRLFVIG